MDELEIFELAERFVRSTVSPGGQLRFSDEDRMRLLNNGVDFPDFSLESLCASLAASVKTISPTKNISYIHEDHKYMWSWCAQIIAHNDTEYFSMEEMNLKQLVQALVHTVKAANHQPDFPDRRDFENTYAGVTEFARLRNEALDRVKLPSTVEQLLLCKTEISSYLSFPLLEGILKKRCSEYVDYSGSVKKEFAISSGKEFTPDKQINSLGVLLFLYFDVVASDFEKNIL
ncbi:hypothetical protein K7N18_05095 [Burkholderia arboris]|uniref:hypothetical protein n=1 Tax=Burkholderia arboris TaxID=488730 RepID=UPI001CA3BFD3|nr:hypothetical protein [Burkholderia arboris]MBY8604203.1 hypothetical protein [Burkholderia arboris]